MKSVTTKRFRKAMNKLPLDIQKRARQVYKIWLKNNHHPGLHFKQIHTTELIYSVRVGLSYRALVLLKMM